jgi:hypothetical protein
MMRSRLLSCVLLMMPLLRFSAQSASPNILNYSAQITSCDVSDSAIINLQIKGCQYDANRRHLPYFIVSNITPAQASLQAALLVRSVKAVDPLVLKAINMSFRNHLTAQFEITAMSSISRDRNYNHHVIVPFRINSDGQVEQLVDYEITWAPAKKNNNNALRPRPLFAASSVLASGSWYKIGTTQTGIHKITRSFLAGIGINVQALDPRDIRVYGNGGKMLPEKNGDARIDDLHENAIFVAGEEDGKMDGQDYILFYATGTTEWKYGGKPGARFRPVKSLFSDTSFYFINVDLGRGKRLTMNPSANIQAPVISTAYDYYNYHETEVHNFAKSGRAWYGEYFDYNTFYQFNWSDGDFVTGDTVWAETTLAISASDASEYSVSGNGLYYKLTAGGIKPGPYVDFAQAVTASNWAMNDNEQALSLTITKLTQKSIAWLDRLTVNARRRLNLSSRQFCFRETRRNSGNMHYNITNPAGVNPLIWNVTDPLNPFVQAYETGAGYIEFRATEGGVSEYCITPAGDYYTPVFTAKVGNQNLHAVTSAHYIIISHPLFVREAERLGRFHQQQEGLSYVVATTDQIYNEFSSGKQDISAIRDFIRMVYTRATDPATRARYVLLIGDGSYNNIIRNTLNNTNFIPTYQSHNSLSATSSIATDDFFGLMDPDEGFNAEGDFFLSQGGVLDLGIGRFTCRSTAEVNGIIDKIVNYYKQEPSFVQDAVSNIKNADETAHGDWRNWLMFFADDGDEAIHMIDANDELQTVKPYAPYYNYDKIFIDAYQRASTPGGSRYPGTSEDLHKRFNKGCLIFNYTGHGGEVGLTAERIIDIEFINNLDNFNRLPLFITATCEFSRYDDPSRTSAGELSLLNARGGAISLMTTCRLAYSSSNKELNTFLLKYLFKRLPDGTMPALGDALLFTKAEKTQNYMFANFHLLGDPALRLAYPTQRVYTSSVVEENTGLPTDTLGALSRITVKGYIGDSLGNKVSGFEGIVYPTVFDKEQLINCLLNTRESAINARCDTCSVMKPFTFTQQKNILYRGKAYVKAGEFSFTFIVPRDISFSPGPGKISYYATNGYYDASGIYSKIVIGGKTISNLIHDDEGPQVKLFFNDKNFLNGGVTNESPVFLAEVSDSSGINTVGTGLGHDVSAVLDGNASAPFILNDYYESDLNSYQSGKVHYPFDKIEPGNHRVTFKAWDILNNSTTSELDFVVAKSADIALEHVLNYPNPFTTHTKFMFEHNQPYTPVKVVVQVYTITGKLVKTIQKTQYNEGFRPDGIEWDGRDDFGERLGRGVYIYKLAIQNPENRKAEKIEKLVILN